MNNLQEKKLRKLIRTLVDVCMDEISTTGGIPAYETPKAFKKKNKKDKKINEGKSKYYEFKNNPDRKTHKQKVGVSIREIKKAMRKLNKELALVNKYKTEMNLSQDDMWNRSIKDILKIENELLKISKQMREIRS